MAKCPNCGEPVSQFAAGCAICGADLEEARRKAAPRRLPGVPSVTVPRLSDLGGGLLLAVVIVLVFPLFGVVIALLQANRAKGSDEWGYRFAFFGVALFGVLEMVSPELRYGVLTALF